MAELSSTEKLLEHIRGKRPSSEMPTEETPAEPLPEWRDRIIPALRFRKSVWVGVDIGYADVRLIKTEPSGTDRHQIIDCRRVPFDPGLDPHHVLFPHFLRKTLTAFAGPADQVSIWSTTSSARLDVRFLRIPKVARRQIPNAVIWAYKRKAGAPDKQRIFDFEVLGETPGADNPTIDVLAYSIPQEDVEGIKTAFQRAGYPLDGVSTYPFLLQNLLRTRWKILAQGRLCALYIGRNWSRIDIFKDGNLMLSRGIRAGLSSMIEEIKADPRMAWDDEPENSEDMGYPPVGRRSDIAPAAVLACLAPGLAISPTDGAPPAALDAHAPDEVFAMIKPALDRLVRQVERTISHYAINVEDHGMDRLCISGILGESERVRRFIADQLGIAPIDLNPFDNETRVSPPATLQEQLAYIPAVGLASPGEDRFPNFLQTFHDRTRRESRQIFNGWVFGLFLLTMAGLLGYNGWQKHKLENRYQHMLSLENRLKEYVPLINPETVLVLATKAKASAERLNRYGERYAGMAVIAEVSRQTPADIKMTRMALRLPRNSDDPGEKPRRILSIDGIVHGERLALEPSLAAYMVRMKTSPLLTAAKVVAKSFERLDDREVLRFTAELEIL